MYYNFQPVISPIDIKSDKLLFVLKSDWTGFFEVDGLIYKIVIREGYIFDGSSIPRIAWSILGKAQVSYSIVWSILHDFLYEYPYTLERIIPHKSCGHTLQVRIEDRWVDAAIKVTRKIADHTIFYIRDNSIMKHNVKNWQVRSMYSAVRLFGNKLWKRDKELIQMNPYNC